MQAILTKYHPPTNYKGARISATCEAGRVIISYPYEKSGAETHREAAIALCIKLGWFGAMVGGQLPSGAYAWVYTEGSPTITIHRGKP